MKVLYAVTEKDIGEDTVADKKYTIQRNTGTISVTNEKTEAILVSLSAKFTGEMKDSSGGKITEEINVWDINPAGTIKWEITVQPGETKNVTYSCAYRRSK